jgi:hypothetical protein
VLEVSAGGNIFLGQKANIVSIGALIPGDKRPGADVVLAAGIGEGAPGIGKVEWKGFADLYLDPANLAAAGPLADQPGKAAKTYDRELYAWLQERFAYAGSPKDALAYFRTLIPEQQRVFLRQVYYAELTAGGREYNDASGPRFHSYLRGREAIAALFPADRAYTGDITMFTAKNPPASVTSSYVHTDFGGAIHFLAPGGSVTIGSEGLTSTADAGLITKGAGDIDIYSKGSVLLGLSRIMTTFGGNILVWSAEGDINAGRGSKNTIIYSPPKRVYDNYGGVTLSPTVPSTGAGIATLAPIPGVAAGDVDLIAPLGTIDAGEAGIRSSGDVNLAALQIINAANIQAQGNVAGVPTIQAPNVAGLTEASNTAGAAAQQAAMPKQDTATARPSIIIVEVLGFGGGGGEEQPHPDDNQRRGQPRSYNSAAPIRVVGYGALTDAHMQDLTEEEKRKLSSR